MKGPKLVKGMKLKRIIPQSTALNMPKFAQMGDIVTLVAVEPRELRGVWRGFFYQKDDCAKAYDIWRELDPNKEGKYVVAWEIVDETL